MPLNHCLPDRKLPTINFIMAFHGAACFVFGLKVPSQSTKQKQTHRHRGQTCDCQGGREVGEGWIESLGLVDANYYI